MSYIIFGILNSYKVRQQILYFLFLPCIPCRGHQHQKRDAWALGFWTLLLGFSTALKMARFWVGPPSYSEWLNLQCMSSFDLQTQLSWSTNSTFSGTDGLSAVRLIRITCLRGLPLVACNMCPAKRTLISSSSSVTSLTFWAGLSG